MCKPNVKWLYVIESDFSWQSGLSIPEDPALKDSQKKATLIAASNLG